MQGAPNASPARTPSHLAAGCGARQRFSPVGGAANGIPLNTRTDGVPVDAPDSWPVSILTGSLIAAQALGAAATITPRAPTSTARFMGPPTGHRNMTSEI